MQDRFDTLPLIVVSGQARSGTTVLTRSIGAHPQVLSNQRENVWLRDLMVMLDQTVSEPRRAQKLPVSVEHFVDEFRNTAMRLLFPDSLWQNRSNDDVRALSTFTSLRADMFEMLPIFIPNFSLVNIIRNGVEVVASRMNHRNIAAAGDFRSHCNAWARSLDVIRWFATRPELREKLFVVRHEQLLDEKACREMFTNLQVRLGLEPSDACENFVAENHLSTNRDAGLESPRTQQGAEARRQLWLKWSEQQRADFEELCGEAMNELEYEIPW